MALAWRPVEISLSPGTGTGREGDLLDEEGGGRPRLTSGFTGTGDGFRGMDRRAIVGTASVTRSATAGPERSGHDEAGQSRAGGP